jgi:hypothetical protein
MGVEHEPLQSTNTHPDASRSVQQPRSFLLPPAIVSMLHECSSEQLAEVSVLAGNILADRVAPPGITDLEPRILAAIAAAIDEGESGGVIALDKIRRHLASVPRSMLDEALLDMEKRETIALKSAQTLRASRAADAIPSERGLLFFVIVQ